MLGTILVAGDLVVNKTNKIHENYTVSGEGMKIGQCNKCQIISIY